MRFSQRIGKLPVKLVQREAMDADLQNSLWNVVTCEYWTHYQAPGYGSYDFVRGSNMEPFVNDLWLHYFKRPIDEIDQYWDECLKKIKDHFLKLQWHGVFDFIEFVADFSNDARNSSFISACNTFLERENSAYRFVDCKIAEITSQEEIDAVEAAIAGSTPYSGVTTHLQTALSLLTNRTNPDYRNSIKESISAVESLAGQIAGEKSAKLGDVLNELEKSHSLHPALKKAFTALYGYTSDAQGIRHALLDEPTLTKADARFMLVACSAFVNYSIDTIAVQ